jgi:hypothetical protein
VQTAIAARRFRCGALKPAERGGAERQGLVKGSSEDPTNVARMCLRRWNDAPLATIGLVLKGSTVSPAQLRRATLYPAELRVLRGSFSRLAWPRQRRCRGGGAGSKAPKAKVTRSNRVGCARKVGAGRAGTVAARFPRIGTSNGRPMVD